jgi:hypothetical protein
MKLSYSILEIYMLHISLRFREGTSLKDPQVTKQSHSDPHHHLVCTMQFLVSYKAAISLRLPRSMSTADTLHDGLCTK